MAPCESDQVPSVSRTYDSLVARYLFSTTRTLSTGGHLKSSDEDVGSSGMVNRRDMTGGATQRPSKSAQTLSFPGSWRQT